MACSGRPGVAEKTVTPVDFSKVQIEDRFWAPRLDRHKTATIPICIEQIEVETGRMRNFLKVAAGEGAHEGFFFDDSDVYKALEGLAYSLIQHPDPVLEAKCDAWIAAFAGAQQEDGYLNTYFTLARPQDRWTDMDKHELYCAGHLVEAAVAYYQATGKRSLLDVAVRMVDHAMTVLGPDKKDWVPGHEEIELALVKLYQVTGERKYLDFADWLLSERGKGVGVYGSGGGNSSPETLAYYQDIVPVRALTDIGGHAVRAMYLYCGMADVAAYTHDAGYLSALDSLWDDVVLRNMYVTGGIGQSAANEGITEDYDLPNLEAYCETCASIGMILWNSRMNQLYGDAKYADVMERSLYNAALAGLSLSGDRFFYVNPLASLGNHHRRPWFGCACCPSNICRFLPSLGSYVYGTSKDDIWVNLYVGSTATFEAAGREVTLRQETDYPWDGTVKLVCETPVRAGLRLRIPDWCTAYSLDVCGERVEPVVEKGYAVVPGPRKQGDELVLTLDMPVRIVAADDRVVADRGKRAVQRGPLVYCLEETDNPDDFDALRLFPETQFTGVFDPTLLDGVQVLRSSEGLTFVPYYAWDNRAAGKMKVWVDYAE